MKAFKEAQERQGYTSSTGRTGRSTQLFPPTPLGKKQDEAEGVEVTLEYNEPHHERIVLMAGEEPRPVCFRRGTKTVYGLEEMEKYKNTEFAYGIRQHEYAGHVRANTQIREGFGTFYYASGEVYYGNWRNNMRSGQGEISTVGGYHYGGEWRDDKITGKGRETFPKGEVFEGEMLNGRPHGNGVLWYTANGSRYEGAFENGRKHGPGAMWYANGDVFQGTWQNGKREGRGLTTYAASGKTYSSEWKNDALTGMMKWIDTKKITVPTPLAEAEPRKQCPTFQTSLAGWHVPHDESELPDFHFQRLKLAFDKLDSQFQGELSLRCIREHFSGVSDKTLLNKIDTRLSGNENAMIDLAELLACWYPNVPQQDIKRYLTYDVSPEALFKLRGALKGHIAMELMTHNPSSSSRGFWQMCDANGELSLEALRRCRFTIGGMRFSERNFHRSNSITDKTTVAFIDCLEIWYPNIEWARLVRYEAEAIPMRELKEISEDFDHYDIDKIGYLSLEKFKHVQSAWSAMRALGRQFISDNSNPIESFITQGYFQHEALWPLGPIRLSVRLLKSIDAKNKTGFVSLVEIGRYCYPNVPSFDVWSAKCTKARPPSPYNDIVQW